MLNCKILRQFRSVQRELAMRSQWQWLSIIRCPTVRSSSVFLPGEPHGRRSLVGYSPQGLKESNTAEATWHTQAAHWTINLVHTYSHAHLSSVKQYLPLSQATCSRFAIFIFFKIIPEHIPAKINDCKLCWEKNKQKQILGPKAPVPFQGLP